MRHLILSAAIPALLMCACATAPVATGVGIGLVANPREYEAAAHLTRYVGRLMGVHDDFLPHSFRDSLRILFQTSRALSTPSSRVAIGAIDKISWSDVAMGAIGGAMRGMRRRGRFRRRARRTTSG